MKIVQEFPPDKLQSINWTLIKPVTLVGVKSIQSERRPECWGAGNVLWLDLGRVVITQIYACVRMHQDVCSVYVCTYVCMMYVSSISKSRGKADLFDLSTFPCHIDAHVSLCFWQFNFNFSLLFQIDTFLIDVHLSHNFWCFRNVNSMMTFFNTYIKKSNTWFTFSPNLGAVTDEN